MKTFILAGVIGAMMATGAMAEEKQVVRKLKACGSEASNSFGKHRENPAINEGAGFVGFETEITDATGTQERYSLVNCATRKMVQVKAEYLLSDSSKGLPGHGDLFAFVDKLRTKKRVANEDLFAKAAKGAGYQIIKGQLPKAYSEKAKRGDCGCGLYYPETMP